MCKRKITKFFFFLSVIMGGVISFFHMNKKIRILQDHACKMYEFYRILVSWLAIRQSNNSLVKYFLQRGYRKVAIYGMKELGERLYEELQNSNIVIQYAIDQYADHIYTKCEVVNPEDRLEDVDVIVVTAVHYFDEIKEKLCKKIDCPIISVEDVVRETENYI